MIKIQKHICCLLIFFLLSALSFAQGVKENFSFEINNTFSEASIGPGDCINFSPTITNTGNIEGYVYFRLEQPVVIGECNTPLYTMNINNSWELRKEHILENKLISIYAYKDLLKTKSIYRSLMLTNSDDSNSNPSILKIGIYQLYNNDVCWRW